MVYKCSRKRKKNQNTKKRNKRRARKTFRRVKGGAVGNNALVSNSNNDFDLLHLESLFEAATIVKNGNEVIEYKGPLIARIDEFKYMKDSLRIPDYLKIEQLANSVFKIENFVIKSLDPYPSLNNSLKTCELTKRAYEEGVGLKYLKHIIVSKDEKNERVYLFTEYLPTIERNFNIKKIEDFAKKISGTSLLFHPDFWYENICITPSGELKAIGWDSYMYDMKSNKIDKSNRVSEMIKRYNDKLKRKPMTWV